MGEQAYEKLRTEVDEAYIKVIYSAHCNKAQTLLADYLKKQIKHHREQCEYISSANLKLQSEIGEAERKINSMLIAQQSIDKAKIELKKELLLTKEKKTDLIMRIETGEKKYNAMWIESKNRYENIPHVKSLINANEKLDNTTKDILKLDETSLKLVEGIDAKIKNCAEIDKKRATELAEFMIKDIPKYHKIIDDTTKAITDLSEKIQEFETKVSHNVVTDVKVKPNSKTSSDSEWPMFKTDDIMVMPTLDLPVTDADALSVKLDKVNIKKSNTENLNTRHKEALKKRFEINMFQSNNKEDLISIYFPKLINHEANETKNYSNRKLINILQDVRVNKDDALKMMSKTKIDSLEPVATIGAEVTNTEMIQNSPRPKSKEPIQSEEIEEIDLTSRSDNILNPPSPFLDISTITINTEDNLQEHDEEEELANSTKEFSQPQSSSQEKDIANVAKRVTFNLSPNINSNEVVDGNIEANGNNELNVTAGSDDGYANIKDMVMKKHNLDSSPPFVYAKNVQLQKNTENSLVTSKFFQQNENNISNNDIDENEPFNNKECVDKPLGTASPEENQPQSTSGNKMGLDIDDEDAVTSPKRHEPMNDPQSIKPVRGLIFNHGAQPIPDSLDLSFSTTGCEDNNFPYCIDSNALLSPKANFPSPCGGDNTEVSQDAPNFLTGLRKSGLSFFGMLPTSESKPESNTTQNAGPSSGFSFNFGGKDEKKARGGLFSMFQ